MINLINKIRTISKIIADFIKSKTEFVLGILFIVFFGIGLIYIYKNIFRALIQAPNSQQNLIFLDRELYKYFKDKIIERHNFNNNAFMMNYRDIFK